MTKQKITIGIPAYNEGVNIGHLLRALLSQKTKRATISKIIVVSDNSIDETNKVVKQFRDKRINLVINPKRKGQGFCQNVILRKATSEILVLLNADILPSSNDFIEKLVYPIIKGVDLTSARIRPTKPTSFFEGILSTSYKIKNSIFEKYNSGNNLYTCNGRARALSKKLYKKIKFRYSAQEDAFSYLFCIKYGFKYRYVKKASVLYALPKNWKDHANQSVRFLKNKDRLYADFGEKFVLENYRLPYGLFITEFVNKFRKNPIMTICYTLVFLSMKIISIFSNENFDIWRTSKTTKKIK